MITAEIDSIGKDGSKYVAYVKVYTDGALSKEACLPYNPNDEKEYKEKLRAILATVGNAIGVIKAKAVLTTAEVVAEMAAVPKEPIVEEKV